MDTKRASRRLLSVVSVAAMALGAVAWDPIGEAHFVVVDLSSAVLADAAVDVTSPNAVTLHERSRADGDVVVQNIPQIDPACVFAVRKAGFTTKTLGHGTSAITQGWALRRPFGWCSSMHPRSPTKSGF
jgi:hypothetical protein